MPTYRNKLYKDIIVGETLVKARDEFITQQYLTKNELSNLEFVSDEPAISPVLFSASNIFKNIADIEFNNIRYKCKFDLHIYNTKDIYLYFNSMDTDPIFIPEGEHCFNNINSALVRKIIFKTGDEECFLNVYMMVT